MRDGSEPATVVREILDATQYMVIGTADASGRPWANPVYFTAHEYRELQWVSRPGTRHSENIAVRPEISVVVFDSHVVPGSGQAVYMEATATEMTDSPDFERTLERFNYGRYAEPAEHDLSVFAAESVRAPAALRLYRAVVSQHYILRSDIDVRMPVDL
ncbi:pyridoxamine 5'-phosphate oxidase family protein [Solicola gregarius]|uniref:Pyridoxamine 5'-phosphate oxidase family protein n=1 Tax=Solicola gregarius TaxID=2908642 RepID=A0AA46TK91_9ACTN|nr:pyridoxamine 5'-phosphate oxidase family protein [Solicola gregarius]UYM06422.1 pyridoxamine 5'-phosphate oxidase family protein [Solicola gregarius]